MYTKKEKQLRENKENILNPGWSRKTTTGDNKFFCCQCEPPCSKLTDFKAIKNKTDLFKKMHFFKTFSLTVQNKIK